MQEQMLGGKGFLVIGYLLEKVSERPPPRVQLNRPKPSSQGFTASLSAQQVAGQF